MNRPSATGALLGAAALLYACAAVGSGLDRLSLNEDVSVELPPQFAAQVHRQVARKALLAGQPRDALAAAWQGVRRAPVEPGAASLLGSAYFALGDTRRAHDAFKVARRMGWRDIATQAYWISAGLALSDRTMVARHLDALMRAFPDRAEAAQILVRLEADAKGQAALAARLAEGPAWIDGYAASAGVLDPAQFSRRMALLTGAKAKGHTPACQAVGDTINAMAFTQNRFAEAHQLWQMGCQKTPSGLIANAHFSSLAGLTTTPFDWMLPGAGGVDSGISQGALIVGNANSVPAIVAYQFVLAQPGRHRLEWTASSDGDASALSNLVTLLCPNGHELTPGSPATVLGGGGFGQDVLVPSDCTPQKLIVRVPPQTGPVRIEQIDLRSGS